MSYNINTIEGIGTNAWKYWVVNTPISTALSLSATLNFSDDPGMITLNTGSSFNGNSYSLNFTNVKTTGAQLFNMQGGLLSNISIGTSLGTRGIVVMNSLLDTQGNSIINTDMYVNGNLNVTKNISMSGNFISNLSSTGILSVINTTQSTSPTTGALVVSGGVGIASNLNISGNLNVNNIARITNTTQTTSKTTGALVVSGGMGIGGNICLNGEHSMVGTVNDFYNFTQASGETTILPHYGMAIFKENLSGSVALTSFVNMYFNITGGNTMCLNGTGLGIGTVTPTTKLDVVGGTKIAGELVVSAGYVGIGTTTPSYPLDVQLYGPSESYTNDSTNIAVFWEAWGNQYGAVNSGYGSWSINTYVGINSATSMKAPAFISNSDKRIKANIEIIDDNLALSKLRLIEPKKYKYIDKIYRGNVEVFGFIAQEIKEKLPEAVSLVQEYIPDIYQLNQYTSISSNLIQLNNITGNLQIGDKLKLVEPNTYNFGNIQFINSNNITVKLEKPITLTGNVQVDSNIFVYGKQVNDFHTVNKDHLFTINFAATQELDRQFQWHTKGIDNSVSGNAANVYGQSLYLENQQLKQQINDILQRLTNANI